MRTFPIVALSLCALAVPAKADPASKPEHLESWNDLGFDLGSGRYQQRFLGRIVLNDRDVENRYELHYGLAWKMRKGFTLNLTAGYAYADDGPQQGRHEAVIGTWKDMTWFAHDALRLHLEGLHRWIFGQGYRYDGFYSVDWWVIGLHLRNVGREAEAGFQVGSGPGFLPFRFEIRMSYGLTAGMPERTGAFVMSFDVD